MAFFADLTPHTYTPVGELEILNVGWLDENRPFSVGPTSGEFRDALFELCKLRRVLAAQLFDCLIALFARTNPGASASELFFKITTARGYWRDSILQTEAKARQGGAPVYSYRLMWRTPIENVTSRSASIASAWSALPSN